MFSNAIRRGCILLKLISENNYSNNQSLDGLEKELQTRSYWYGADCLIGLTLLSFLFLSNYLTNWGMIQNSTFQIFPQAIILYLFFSTIPLRMLLLVLSVFIISTFVFAGSFGTNIFLLSGYLCSLLAASVFLKRLSWPFRAFIPIIIHAIGAIGLAICFAIEKQSLAEYIHALKVLSLNSLIAELLLIYPLTFLSDQIAKGLNWCKFFE